MKYETTFLDGLAGAFKIVKYLFGPASGGTKQADILILIIYITPSHFMFIGAGLVIFIELSLYNIAGVFPTPSFPR